MAERNKTNIYMLGDYLLFMPIRNARVFRPGKNKPPVEIVKGLRETLTASGFTGKFKSACRNEFETLGRRKLTMEARPVERRQDNTQGPPEGRERRSKTRRESDRK